MDWRKRPTRAEKLVGALAWVLLSFYYVRGLRAFLALSDLELYLIAFLKALVALGSDGAVVHKDIRPI